MNKKHLEFNGAVFTPNGFELSKNAYYNHRCEIISEELSIYTFLDGSDLPFVESRLIDILGGKNEYYSKIFLIILKNEYDGIMLKGYERVVRTEDFLNRYRDYLTPETNANMELIGMKLVSKNTGEVVKLM